MKSAYLAAGILAAALAGSPAAAVEPKSDEEAQKLADEYNEKLEDSRDEVICTREAVTGSRIKKTVCRSRLQSELQAEEIRKGLRKYPTTTLPPG